MNEPIQEAVEAADGLNAYSSDFTEQRSHDIAVAMISTACEQYAKRLSAGPHFQREYHQTLNKVNELQQQLAELQRENNSIRLAVDTGVVQLQKENEELKKHYDDALFTVNETCVESLRLVARAEKAESVVQELRDEVAFLKMDKEKASGSSFGPVNRRLIQLQQQLAEANAALNEVRINYVGASGLLTIWKQLAEDAIAEMESVAATVDSPLAEQIRDRFRKLKEKQ